MAQRSLKPETYYLKQYWSVGGFNFLAVDAGNKQDLDTTIQ